MFAPELSVSDRDTIVFTSQGGVVLAVIGLLFCTYYVALMKVHVYVYIY